MEVILVDDGSTDNTTSLCEKYSKKNNITVIHQKNAGLSEARNRGIDLAKGNLITFVDSDDYLVPNTYEPLLVILKNNPQYDILEYSVIKEDGDKTIQDLTLCDNEYTNMAEYWIKGKAYAHSYAWNKIYRRRLFKDVRFPKGKKFEDVYMLPAILKEANVVRTTSMGLYHYTYNRNGITVNADGKAWLELLQAHIPLIHDKTLRVFKEFAEYYSHVLNIQIYAYEYNRSKKSILLPTLPYYQNTKLKLLHIMGMKNLCELFYWKDKILNMIK